MPRYRIDFGGSLYSGELGCLLDAFNAREAYGKGSIERFFPKDGIWRLFETSEQVAHARQLLAERWHG